MPPALLAVLLATTGCATPEPADLVLLGGKILTLEADRPEAEALAARGGRIVALGTAADLRRLIGSQTRVIELGDAVAIPGLIEGHGHFTGIGNALLHPNLAQAADWPEVVARVASAASHVDAGEWIAGRGWHQEKWNAPPADAIHGYPTHALLSREVPAHPVLVTHASGHAALANALALERAGIDANTPDPPGGRILRDPAGRPTGVLLEKAVELVQRAREIDEARRTPAEHEARARREIELAAGECLAKGLTSFQDAGSDFDTVDRLRAMAEEGRLGPRLWVMLRVDNDELERRIGAYRLEGVGDQHLTVRAIKRAIDGALGSHSAWLLEPYDDWAGNAGLNTAPLDDLERTARIALAHDFQLCVHAIGDRANRETLDLYERLFAEQGGKRDLRWRIEHAQHLSPDDIPRFAELGVVASMQGIHCTSDAPWVFARIGERRALEGAYVWRALIDSGAVVSNGTDAPVEDVDPIASFHATVTRKTADGSVFHPAQRMTRLEALRSYTINAAYAAREEAIKGSLAPGKLADVTVLSQDLLEVPDDRLLATRVLYTIVGGKVLFERRDG